MSEPRSAHRRDFLQGWAAVQALQDAVERAGLAGEETPDANAAESDAYLMRLSRRAMACQFEVLLPLGKYPQASAVALEALDLIEQLEDQLTVYRDHSEISRLNQRAFEQPIVVESRLFKLLQLAAELHAESAGAYDITASPLSKAWGFTRRRGQIPSPEMLAAALESVGSQYLQLDADARSVRFTKPGVEINLGSIGKGYALDRCAELFACGEIGDYVLHGGHSSVLARGTHPGSVSGGWKIGVRDPLRPDRHLGEVMLEDAALSTSGSGTQYFLHEGERYGHILDPRTGWPAQCVLSSTVLAPTAALADALSTAFYVMGADATEEYCRRHPEVSALLVCQPDPKAALRSGAVVTRAFGLMIEVLPEGGTRWRRCPEPPNRNIPAEAGSLE